MRLELWVILLSPLPYCLIDPLGREKCKVQYPKSMFTLAARHQGSVCEKCLSLIQVTHIQIEHFCWKPPMSA